jgi:hypothetical protein
LYAGYDLLNESQVFICINIISSYNNQDNQILLNSFNLKNPDIHHHKHTLLCIHFLRTIVALWRIISDGGTRETTTRGHN